MSDHIPLDLQEEIIKRLPIKSLIQGRAVSKAWKSLIDSTKFIADYRTHSQHLFIHSGYQHLTYKRYEYKPKYEYVHECVEFIDDDTFPQGKISLPGPSTCVNVLTGLIGYSHGLFCLVGFYYCPKRHTDDVHFDMAVIWNPSIRKSVDILLPKLSDSHYLGFGVCPATNEPKILKIEADTGTSATSCPYKYNVKVYTLSSYSWRRPLSKLPDKWRKAVCKLPDHRFQLIGGDYPVVIDGFIYWFASCDRFYIIVSFDLTIEEFKHIYLPDKLAFDNNRCLDYHNNRRLEYRPIYKLRESLAVVKYESIMGSDKQVYRVWIMDNPVSKLFTEIFTITLPYHAPRKILGFRNNEEVIMETKDDESHDHDRVMLVAYEPGSEQINKLEIYGERDSCFVGSYKESLLLLDQRDAITTNFNSHPRVKSPIRHQFHGQQVH